MSNIRLSNTHISRVDGNSEEIVHARNGSTRPVDEDLLEVFDLDDQLLEPEPEYGDFWEEWDDDCDNSP